MVQDPASDPAGGGPPAGHGDDDRISEGIYLDYAFVRDDHNLITLPYKLEYLEIVEPGETVRWLKHRDHEFLALGRYEMLFKNDPAFTVLDTVEVSLERVVTVPVEFFDVYPHISTDPQRHVRHINDPFQVSYATPYHFVTTDSLGEKQACYLVPDDRLDQLITAADMYRRILEEDRARREAEKDDEIDLAHMSVEEIGKFVSGMTDIDRLETLLDQELDKLDRDRVKKLLQQRLDAVTGAEVDDMDGSETAADGSGRTGTSEEDR